jgi:hypothetical protein
MADLKLTLNKVMRKGQHLLGSSNTKILAAEVPSAFLVKLWLSDTNPCVRFTVPTSSDIGQAI